MADDWYTQPMSDYGSASDQFYGAGGQSVGSYSMPMDAGPAFQDWGSYGALSGQDQSMGMGWQQPQSLVGQPDQTFQSMQYGLNQAGGQDPAAYTPEIQPSGGGSWFKRLLSTTIFGMAQGAGAPDPGTAFAAGYMGMEQQKERERQMIAQQQQMQRQQYMWELDRTKKNLEIMKLAQDYESAPQELQIKATKAEADFVSAMASAGKSPEINVPYTAEAMAEYSAQALAKGENPLQKYFFAHVGNNILGFTADPTEVAPMGMTIPINGINQPVGGMPWANVKDLISDANQRNLDLWKTTYTQQQENQRATGYQQATLGAASIRNQTNMNNVPEDVNIRINQLSADIKRYQDVINNYSIYKSPNLKDQAAQATGQIERLKNEINNLIAPYSSGAGTAAGTTSPLGGNTGIDYSKPVSKNGKTGYLQPNGQVYVP